MGLDPQQRRITITIVLFTLALCAVFLAQGTTHLMASSLLPLRAQAGALASWERPRSSKRKTTKKTRDSHTILGRNIFDSKTGPLWPPPPPESENAEEETPAEEGEDPNRPPEPCDNAVRLVGAMVSTRKPELSFAALNVGGETRLYRPGMEVDGRELVSIYPNTVVMKPDGEGPCLLQMFDKNKPPGYRPTTPLKRPPSKPASKRARVRPSRKGGIANEELDQGISKQSETSYTVSRTLVDRVLANQAELMRTARIIPHEQNGRVIGVKLYGIRRNSLLGRIGIQNGDVLRTINGYDMTAPDSALEAYARLRNANRLTVSVTRRGRAMNLEYQIQ